MKKTFTINISGTIFHIEDDAYEKLQNYLISMKNHFGNDEEGSEIVSDIESRIAELFSGKMRSNQEAVTLDLVNQIVAIMGTPEDLSDEEEPDTPEEATKRRRRLYRLQEKAVIGGVCSGLGAYFNIDPLIVRIIMVILALFNGVGLLAYIVLWIAVPKAVTTAQRLEVRGQEVTVSNIEKSIREDVKEEKDGNRKPGLADPSGRAGEKSPKAGDTIGNFFMIILKIFVVTIGVIFILTGFLGLLAFISSLVIGQSFLGYSPELDVPGFVDRFVDPGALLTGIIALAFVAGIPLLLLLFAGTKLVFRYRSNNVAIVLAMIGIWFVALLVLMGVAAGQLRNFSDSSSITETRPIDCGGCGTLYLDLEEDRFENDPEPLLDLDNYRIVEEDDREILLGKPRLTVEKSDSEEFALVVSTVARGRTRALAREAGEKVSYHFTVKDSTAFFDPYFSAGEDSKWRNQKVKLIVRVPVGKTIFLGREMIGLIHDIPNVTNTWDGDMVDHYWEMTPNGLALKDQDQQ